MAKEKRASVYFDRDTQHFKNITDDVKKTLSETFPGVNINQELGKMELWLNEHPSRMGAIGFIMNWLQRACPKPSINTELDAMQSDSSLGVILRDYLEDLWKNREHILTFNTIRKPA